MCVRGAASSACCRQLGAALAAAFEAAQPASPTDPFVLALARRVGLCGNGICEVGERTVEGLVEGSCPQDCSFPSMACPETCGAGACMPALGTCRCFAGHAGATCQECAPGFMQVRAGVCVGSGLLREAAGAALPPSQPALPHRPAASLRALPLPQAGNNTCIPNVVELGLASPSATPDDDASVDTAAAPEGGDDGGGGGGVNVGAIVGPIIAVVAVLAVAVAFVVQRRRRREFDRFGSQHSPTTSSGALRCATWLAVTGRRCCFVWGVGLACCSCAERPPRCCLSPSRRRGRPGEPARRRGQRDAQPARAVLWQREQHGRAAQHQRRPRRHQLAAPEPGLAAAEQPGAVQAHVGWCAQRGPGQLCCRGRAEERA